MRDDPRRRRRRRGSGLIVVMVLVIVSSICVFANAVALRRLGSYLNEVEKQHTKRLAPPASPKP